MKKVLSMFLSFIVVASILNGCSSNSSAKSLKEAQPVVKASNFKFDVSPETFQITVDSGGVKEKVSDALPKMEVANVKKSDTQASWSYPKENIDVVLKKQKDYLDVKIKSSKEGKFTWPNVSGESYVLPIGEGKLIPSSDGKWKEFLNKMVYTLSQDFSMQFFAVNKKKYSVVYVIENMFNNEINFDTKDKIKFSFSHEFPSINKEKEYSFRIYVSPKNPVDIAGIYKGYIKEKGKFTTLESKAKSNENIKKLYGAPQIYLWGDQFISQDNINWPKLIKKPTDKGMEWIKSFLNNNVEEGKEASAELDNIKKDGFASKYQKNLISKTLNQALLSKDFCNTDAFTELDVQGKKLKSKGIDKLNKVELYDLNKRALKSELKDAIDPIEKWGNGSSIDLLKDINKAGIKSAWLGFDNWTTGLINPGFVKYANDSGYLIAPYDSYHSIQQNADDSWITASFKDKSLYENATVTNKNGIKIAGFLGKGRKLNPTLSMPSVKDRVNDILGTGVKYNSWFIDCDATGEVYDDYSPNHITTQEQDMKARLKRMEYIRDNKKMVIGSEGGNDYASQTIAFAQGIETPVIAWDDKDMRENKDSEYYVGQYWSANGEIPSKYSKQVPIKDLYKAVYIDPTYSLPLFKLVYNNSVITTHQWEWGSFKIKDEVKDRMLYEILYNVPPLYHLDKKAWEDNKSLITSHINVWAPFNKKAVTKEMTDFEVLSKDKLVQMTKYGKSLKVVANLSNKDFKYENDVIKAKSLIIYDSGKNIKYIP